MTNITFYGGVGEIGGNKIILTSKEQSLMLDWGLSFGGEGKYFEEFLQPRTNSVLQDYLRLGLTPNLDGIYRKDLLKCPAPEEFSQGQQKHLWCTDIKSYDEYAENKNPFIDGILISHAHIDHCGYLGLLDPKIPTYFSQTTDTILDTMDRMGMQGILGEMYNPSDIILTQLKSGYTPGALRLKKEPVQRNTNPKDKPFEIKDFHVVPHPVDHSLLGATAFEIHTPDDLTVVYTGDLRFHGRQAEKTKRFVKKVSKKEVDVLITEGTRIEDKEKDSEKEVYEETLTLVEQAKSAVFVGFAWKDITRYQTIKQIAEKTGKTFVISAKTAFLLHQLDGYNNPEEESHVKVYLPRSKSMLYSMGDYTSNKYDAGYLADWSEQQDFTHIENGVRAHDIAKDPEQYIVFLDYFHIKELLDIGPVPNSIYVRAQSEPFNEEMKLSEERLINWLTKFKINEDNDNEPYQVHASGHASGSELIQMINDIQPKTVIPVHTEQPERFQKMLEGVKVTLPEYGEDIRF
ncbi:MAG: MBL fold metallo-hydrolase [Thermoplasmata archaeon]